jgi:hypothetical protein
MYCNCRLIFTYRNPLDAVYFLWISKPLTQTHVAPEIHFPKSSIYLKNENTQDDLHVYLLILRLTGLLDWDRRGHRVVNYANLFLLLYIRSISLGLYGNDVLVVLKNYITDIYSADMTFLWSVKYFARMDGIRNYEIQRNLEIYSLEDKMN